MRLPRRRRRGLIEGSVMSVSILVVDDEPDVAELFRQRFRHEVRQGHYVMHFAASAEEALDKLDEGIRPELIVDAVRHQHARHGRVRAAAARSSGAGPSCR